MDFSKIVRLYIPESIEGILDSRCNSHGRLIERLNEINFVTNKISNTADSVEIELQILDPKEFYALLSGEANQFLLASLISEKRAEQVQIKNASWQLVEHYYSAYYAAHYLIRLTGLSLTNLDQKSTDIIARSNLLAGVTSSVPKGLYVMTYNDSTNLLVLTKDLRKPSGGSHKDAWKLWDGLTSKLQNNANIDPIEYSAVSMELLTHKRFLGRSTGHYSPSEIRSEINYQFKGKSWTFEKDSSPIVRRIQLAITKDIPAILPVDASSENLVLHNKLVIGLARSVFMHSASSYPKSISRSIQNQYKDVVRCG